MLDTFSRRACISSTMHVDICKENICTDIITRIMMILLVNTLVQKFIGIYNSKIRAKNILFMVPINI
jgi:hypothetical protein